MSSKKRVRLLGLAFALPINIAYFFGTLSSHYHSLSYNSQTEWFAAYCLTMFFAYSAAIHINERVMTTP
jgi:hypothetical protein